MGASGTRALLGGSLTGAPPFSFQNFRLSIQHELAPGLAMLGCACMEIRWNISWSQRKNDVLRLRSKIALAVTAMIDVALNYPHGPVSLSKICGRRKISMTYLEEIFSRLMAHQLVESTRGPGGGYSLSKGPEEINLADIALAVDESMGNSLSMISGTMKVRFGPISTDKSSSI